jgi:hypothetical protein
LAAAWRQQLGSSNSAAAVVAAQQHGGNGGGGGGSLTVAPQLQQLGGGVARALVSECCCQGEGRDNCQQGSRGEGGWGMPGGGGRRDKESTVNTCTQPAQQCQEVKALPWNNIILPWHVSKA